MTFDTFPVTASVVVFCEVDGVEARWSRTSGCLAFVDMESGLRINDGMKIIKDEAKARQEAEKVLKFY